MGFNFYGTETAFTGYAEGLRASFTFVAFAHSGAMSTAGTHLGLRCVEIEVLEELKILVGGENLLHFL